MRSAAHDELVTLTRTAGFFATHQRDYAGAIFTATDESLSFARDAGVPVQIAHLQMNGPGNKGRADEMLAHLDKARASGIDVTCDTYPYTAGSTFIQSMPRLGDRGWPGGDHAQARRTRDAPSRYCLPSRSTRIAQELMRSSHHVREGLFHPAEVERPAHEQEDRRGRRHDDHRARAPSSCRAAPSGIPRRRRPSGSGRRPCARARRAGCSDRRSASRTSRTA